MGEIIKSIEESTDLSEELYYIITLNSGARFRTLWCFPENKSNYDEVNQRIGCNSCSFFDICHEKFSEKLNKDIRLLSVDNRGRFGCQGRNYVSPDIQCIFIPYGGGIPIELALKSLKEEFCEAMCIFKSSRCEYSEGCLIKDFELNIIKKLGG